MRIQCVLVAAAIAASACGTSVERPGDGMVSIVGVTQVLMAGTRSETVIIEVTETGEVFALVGDLAPEIAQAYGTEISVTGRSTDEGWSVREELPRIWVVEYSVLDFPEPGEED